MTLLVGVAEPNVGLPRFVLIAFRAFLAIEIAKRWPPVRTGKRGRPPGSGWTRLAKEMRYTRSALLAALDSAQRRARLDVDVATDIAHALGMELDALVERNHRWVEALIEREIDR